MLWCSMLNIAAEGESIPAGPEEAQDTGWSSDSNAS